MAGHKGEMKMHHELAMGQKPDVFAKNPGRTPGYKRGGSVAVAHKFGGLDGHISGHHHHSHKSHGHHVSGGVHHHKSGSAFSGTGESIKADKRGPSNNQFGGGKVGGGSLGKW